MLETPNVDWIIYSDDITVLAKNDEDYFEAINILIPYLKKFGMCIDDTKTQFIRFGDVNLTKFIPNADNVGFITHNVFLKFLGFMIKDCDIDNIM